MRVRYTANAVAELEEILAYLTERNPAAAASVASQIEAQIKLLGRFPFLGPPKYKSGVRMRTVPRYPILIFYSVKADEVLILGIRHAARRPWNEER
jgi:toxin ParE1/3/4